MYETQFPPNFVEVAYSDQDAVKQTAMTSLANWCHAGRYWSSENDIPKYDILA